MSYCHMYTHNDYSILCIYIYIYIHVYVCMCIYIYIYIYMGVRRQGLASKRRNSFKRPYCPVVICPYLCSSVALKTQLVAERGELVDFLRRADLGDRKLCIALPLFMYLNVIFMLLLLLHFVFVKTIVCMLCLVHYLGQPSLRPA